jgi:hypothetical protein
VTIARVLLAVCIILISNGVCPAVPLAITNADFSTIPIVCQGFSYQSFGGDCTSIPRQQDFNGAAGFGWILGEGGTGLTAPNSLFNPPDFSGLPFAQAVFLQGGGSFAYQAIAGFAAGTTYQLSFYVGSRFISNVISDGDQTVEATIDAGVIGMWSLVSFTPFTPVNVAFSVLSSGTHTLGFDAVIPGDHTAFVSGVAITQATPEPSTFSLLIGSVLLGILKLGCRVLR